MANELIFSRVMVAPASVGVAIGSLISKRGKTHA